MVYVCIDDIVCRLSFCDEYSNSAKRAILHELAHIWMKENLSPERRERFMTATNTVAWADKTLPWHERGVERAAEIVALGLSDKRLDLIRLSFPQCEVTSKGYFDLTGLPSPWDCATDPGE